MKDEVLYNLFSPKKAEDWILVKTNTNIYSLRYGAYKIEDGIIDYFDYEEILSPFHGYTITTMYSDNYWLFILLENGGVISAGEVDISLSGETKLGVQFEKITDFDQGFFESGEVFEIVTGELGKSVKI